MTTLLHQHFVKNFMIDITTRQCREIEALMIDFETRNEHPLALNSQLMGVHSIKFTYEDQNEIFDIFGITAKEINRVIDQDVLVSDGKKMVRLIPKEHKVRSNPLNLLLVWTIHLVVNNKSLSTNQKQKTAFHLAKLLVYRFYTSLLHRRFPHQANEEVMKATINQLDNKSDIIRYGTWKNLLEAQAAYMVSSGYINVDGIRNFKPDEEVLRCISGSQTSIRNKINLLYKTFKEIKDAGDLIGSYSTTGELEGVKIVLNRVSKYDAMINNLMNEVPNTSGFINDKNVRLISSLFKNISNDLLLLSLSKFSTLASIQNKSGKANESVVKKGVTIYTGYGALISNIIQKSYRYCFKKNVKFTSHVHVLNQLKNIYSSSRISDEDLLSVKESVSYMIDEQKISTRTATNSSLKIAFILYIITKTFKYVGRQ